MGSTRADTVVRYAHLSRDRVRQPAHAADDTQAVRDAARDIQTAELHIGDAARITIQAHLQRGAPSIAFIVTAAPEKIGALGDGGSSKNICAHRKSSAEKDAAAIRKILEQAIFDAIARAPVNGAAIGKKR